MAKVPERIGKYEVIRRLGYGGMGTVYLARDPDLDRLLAIKVLRDLLFEEELIQRFLREARAAGNLRHDNIITVYDAGQHDHQPFMAMEYVDGTSLAELIKVRHTLTLADKLSYLEQICAGLHYAHSRGIVHRDIKPANLMVDRHHIIRILDFGIARVEGSGMTREGALIGTLNYMSPEQMLGRAVDHRSDIFAFGAVAYELITYHRAFPGSIDDGLLQRLPHEPPRPIAEVCPGLPDELEPLIMRALAKQPHDRFADLEEARIAFRNIRRQLDPELDIEPIAGQRRGRGGSATPTPGALSERREFLERRAHQVAYHRDAARKALQRGDLDAAAAACEDALTLDPADQDSLQLLGEIEQAQQVHGFESKERRDRERTIRRHLADADLKLSKGDVATAAQLLHHALALDPQNTAALELLSRIEHGAPPQPAVAPTVVRPRTKTPPPDSAAPPAEPAATAGAEQPKQWWTTKTVAIAAAAILAVAAVLWISTRDTDSPPATTVAERGAADGPATAPSPATPSITAPPPLPAPAPSPAAGAANAGASQPSPGAVRPGPAPASNEESRAAVRTPSSPGPTTRPADPVVPPVAPPPPAASTAAGPAAVTPPPASAPAANTPPPAPSPVPSPVAAAPAPAPSPPPAAAPAAPRPLDIERAGLMRAMGRYQDAYRSRDIDALKSAYPRLPREMEQALRRAFSRDCAAYDVGFLNLQFALNPDDPTSATATALSTYTCQGRTGQKPNVTSGEEAFRLRKVGDTWVIDRAILDASAR